MAIYNKIIHSNGNGIEVGGTTSVKLNIKQPTNISRNDGQLAQTAWSNGRLDEANLANLLNCMEIDWGDAEFSAGVNISDLVNSDGTISKVKSSYDILRLIFWLYEKVSGLTPPGPEPPGPEEPFDFNFVVNGENVDSLILTFEDAPLKSFKLIDNNGDVITDATIQLIDDSTGEEISSTDFITIFDIQNDPDAKWILGNWSTDEIEGLTVAPKSVEYGQTSAALSISGNTTIPERSFTIKVNYNDVEKSLSITRSSIPVLTAANGGYTWASNDYSGYYELSSSTTKTVRVTPIINPTNAFVECPIYCTLKWNNFLSKTYRFDNAIKILHHEEQQQTEYYWYVGQTDPSTMTEISPIVTDNTSPGWRLIGAELPNYSSTNKLWDGSIISTGSTKTTNYVALPNSSLFMYDAAGNISSSSWTSVGTKEINNVTYNIYSSVANLKSFGFNIY